MSSLSYLTKRLILGLWLLFSLPTQAQDRFVRQFNTQTVRAFTLRQYPEYGQKLQDLESRLPALIAKSDKQPIFQIPVLVHLLLGEGQTMPNDEQVQAQIDLLNQQFGHYSPQTKDFPNEDVARYATQGVDVGIQFVLLPTLTAPTGIERVKTDRKSWDLFNQIQDPKQGGVAPVDPEHTLNIWVGELTDANAGYAHLPGAPVNLDGIVIDPDFFGTNKGPAKAPYNGGKTLIHLVGTYLGLYELWDEANPCQDDGVVDTPLHSGPNTQVLTEKNSRQICFCPGAPTAMYLNFMDNTDDAQLVLFTQGQKDRMRAMLSAEGPRAALIKR